MISPFPLFFLIAYAVYWPTLRISFTFDDYEFYESVGRLPFYKIGKVFIAMEPYFVRPVGVFTFWLQHFLFGTATLPPHLISVGLHAALASLIFCFLLTVGIKRRTAFFAALLIVVMPIAPETVTWLSGRFDLLAVLFSVLTLECYAIFLKGSSRVAYIGALLFLIAAVLSKESALVLVVLLPAMDLLFLGSLRAAEDSPAPNQPGLAQRLKPMVSRMAPFLGLILIAIILRYALVGVGGYSTPFAVPDVKAVTFALGHFFEPYNSYMMSMAIRYIFGIYALVLFAVSLALVISRWKHASIPARRLWIFFLIMTVTSIAMVSWSIFTRSMVHDLSGSRLLYAPAVAILVMMVIGLYEFGWEKKGWRLGVSLALCVLAVCNAYGLRENNHAWELAAQKYDLLTSETQALLPDPERNARLYYEIIPDTTYIGDIIDGTLAPAIRMKYNRTDLLVGTYDPPPVLPEGSDGYLFHFDGNKGELTLVHPPLRESSD